MSEPLPDSDAPGVDAPDTEDNGNPANREAAKWRTQLRAAEKERDTLQARVTAMQTAEVIRLASSSLAVPSDVLSMNGNDIASFIDLATGNVDATRVASAVDALIASRPGLAKATPPANYDGGDIGSNVEPKTSWSDLLKSARQ